MCMSSENNETNDYGHDFIILAHLLHVSYPTKSGCREKYLNNTRLSLGVLGLG